MVKTTKDVSSLQNHLLHLLSVLLVGAYVRKKQHETYLRARQSCCALHSQVQPININLYQLGVNQGRGIVEYTTSEFIINSFPLLSIGSFLKLIGIRSNDTETYPRITSLPQNSPKRLSTWLSLSISRAAGLKGLRVTAIVSLLITRFQVPTTRPSTRIVGDRA